MKQILKHELPKLPFAPDALEPYISEETLNYHYSKHHKAYVDKLNELIAGTKFEYMPLEEIILTADGAIFNNAAQAWNHTFFWNSLTPITGGAPTGKMKELITKKWGDFETFQAEFSEVAVSQFGSGWAWLVLNKKNEIEIMSTSNADTPKKHGCRALLTLDVWEHAYYLDYQNERPKFVEAFWNLVNWNFVNENLTR